MTGIPQKNCGALYTFWSLEKMCWWVFSLVFMIVFVGICGSNIVIIMIIIITIIIKTIMIMMLTIAVRIIRRIVIII